MYGYKYFITHKLLLVSLLISITVYSDNTKFICSVNILYNTCILVMLFFCTSPRFTFRMNTVCRL